VRYGEAVEEGGAVGGEDERAGRGSGRLEGQKDWGGSRVGGCVCRRGDGKGGSIGGGGLPLGGWEHWEGGSIKRVGA